MKREARKRVLTKNERCDADQYDEYWDVNKRLFLDPGGPPMRHVPLRLYLPDLQCPPIQELVKYDHDNDDDNSSGEFFIQWKRDQIKP